MDRDVVRLPDLRFHLTDGIRSRFMIGILNGGRGAYMECLTHAYIIKMWQSSCKYYRTVIPIVGKFRSCTHGHDADVTVFEEIYI